MFGKIASFEFRYQLKNPVFWVAAGVFFLLTFLSVVIDNVTIGGGGATHRNAPFAIATVHLVWTLFFMFVTTAFVANVIVRDDETGFGGILRSTRVKRFDYLYGRFTGAFAAAALAFLSIPLAIVVGSFMPWVDPETLGPLSLQPFLVSYFALALPNILLTSALFFALATVTRSLMWTYVGVVAFLVIWTVASIALGRPEWAKTVALWEPLGFGALDLATKYWTVTDRNTLTPVIEGVFLQNRIFSLVLSALFLALPMLLFRFVPGKARGKRARQMRIAAAAAASAPPPAPLIRLPRPSFGMSTAWSQLITRTRLDMGQVFGSPAFAVLLAIGLFNSVGALWFTTEETGYGGMIYPLTRMLIPALLGSFTLIPQIIAIYYAGELVWRERDKKTHEIIDASPVPDWAFVLPKTLAISLVLIATLLVSVLAAVAIQTIKGYTDYEFGKWLLWYVLPQTVSSILIAALAVFMQALSPHKFVGWGLMALFVVARMSVGNIGLDHILYIYGATTGTPLSDINGVGKFWIGAWIGRTYWTLIALLLLILTWGLWRRGTETRLWPRFARLPHRLMSRAGVFFAVVLIGAVAVGSYIFVNTNVWNEHRTEIADEKWQAEYEKELIEERHFDKVVQPKIQSMKLDVDLRPHQPSLRVYGSYVIKNTTNQDIKEIHVRFDRDLKVYRCRIMDGGVDAGWPKETLAKFNYRILSLAKPMKPGDELTLTFATERSQKGFKNRGNDTRVVDNGTFVNSMEFAPALGIWTGDGLNDRNKRKKYGLKNVDQPMAPLGDEASRQFQYIRHDADRISSDITFTTEADQTPIAPGRRVSDRIIDTPEGKRRQARFVTAAPIMPFVSLQSARYAIRRQTYKGVELEIYYQPEHAYNLDRMFTAMKTSLDYFQTNFSPYQFDYLRFIEFPAYGNFAQAFAGTMPWSENLFFIADYRDPSKIDMVTYVGAHEIGHQWWAHQVVGADQEGMTLTSETLAQYSALRVMKQLYGEDQIRKFLKYELNSYLGDRGSQVLEEHPMIRVDSNQPYVHYRKGSLVMYRLADEIGEDRVNAALRQLIAEYGGKGPPYPTAWTFYELLKAQTPREKWPLLDDLLLHITLYDVKVTDAKVTARKDGKYDVSFTVDAKKLYATGKGKETPSPMNEMLDIGVFTKQPGEKGFDKSSIQVLERRAIHSGKQVLTYTVAKKPVWVGADPYNILIDRNADDNLSKIGS